MAELRIGVVAEGISDHRVIKHLVEQYLKNKDIDIIQLQPEGKTSVERDGFGGWSEVFKFIQQEKNIKRIKRYCDYLIIQIDTDVCERYDVPKHSDHETLFNEVRAKIFAETHSDFDRTKIIPAICIHELECWLIPFVTNDKAKCEKVDNCVNVVNYEIRTVGSIDKNNKGEALKRGIYDFILAKKKKAKEIQAIADTQYNFGFSKFIESLSTV